MPGQGFPAEFRLLKSSDFQRVFELGTGVGARYFFMRYAPNQLDYPRIGFAFTKKKVRKAVQRNTLKRIARELFRLNRGKIPPIDIVLMATKHTSQADKPTLSQALSRFWGETLYHEIDTPRPD